MTTSILRKLNLCFLAAFAALSFSPCASAQSATTLPSESAAQVKSAADSFDYSRREVMIPMRDGVKLHTVILIPKGAKNAPILLTRTPYNANDLTTRSNSSHLGPSLYGYDNATDVIVQGGQSGSLVSDIQCAGGGPSTSIMQAPTVSNNYLHCG